MENQLFTSSLISPSLHVESLLQFPNWQTLEMQMNGTSDQSLSGFYSNSNWERLNDHEMKFNSLPSSLMMCSNVVTSHPSVSNGTSVIRELIGKLGGLGNSSRFSASLPSHAMFGQSNLNNSQSNSSYNASLNSLPLNPSVAEFSADPGFPERAAKFSRFESRSFNGRTSQLGLNNVELPHNSALPMLKEKLPRVSSSPSFNLPQSQMNVQQHKRPTLNDRTELSNSQDESSVSQLVSSGEAGQGTTNDTNSRKRKAVPRGKAKESAPLPSSSASKANEENENSETKRSKQNESNGKENDGVEAEDEAKRSASTAGDEKQQNKPDFKPSEPPKDYIHVRARRGQATDSHSLAERVRREKISERMKILQDLVPGCNKVIGKALMLDEIINYVQSLQRQVEFLSMKLATVDTSMDFNNDPLTSKDTFPFNKGFQQSPFPVDSSSAAFFGQQPRKIPTFSSNILNGTAKQSPVDPLNGTKMPSLDGHGLSNNNGHVIPYHTFCDDDLQTIIQMGFGQSTPIGSTFHQGFVGSDQISEMKLEM